MMFEPCWGRDRRVVTKGIFWIAWTDGDYIVIQASKDNRLMQGKIESRRVTRSRRKFKQIIERLIACM